ncbi:LacI family DNA-binding transcriptional regulator [Desulfopila sp. IMCC35008]|uniref:LacI family DNA-binding transcriptional regulator n=1 Tax=Desulfopila sp. IMCC35008 TaxID=2653858 RepID=UPI0013D5088B|nr:LacI family DNA-binding transcriptional regulator [Desulfopila sp. IMCC35008]
MFIDSILDFGGIVISTEKQRRGRPGIVEVAEAAQVSTATVDRVLNNRGGVREATAKRVLSAATELGYLFDSLPVDNSRVKPLKVVFLLPTGTNPYLKHLEQIIRTDDHLQRSCNVRCDCKLVHGFDAGALAKEIRSHATSADGIAVMGLEHPIVREAVNEVTKRGTPVVTIITDVSNCSRTAFVGLDNRAVGRTAAHLMARFSGRNEGDVGLIAGSLSYLAHNEREMGFLAYMQENYPGLRVVGAREGHDDFEENYQLTLSFLKQHQNLVGIYNIGGSSGGVAAALLEAGKGDSLVFIGHGLGEDTRMMLIEETMDIVIHQDPLALVHNTCQIFLNLSKGIAPLGGIPKLSMQIICRENLP